ncbi:hypothetical protein PVA45_01485 [Entomospira entomophila]|uniref:Uncharacterized protein n=1 Tax=Entomospira entomophila TaxID=2719988 RepID=A0A968KTD3_9SPIO|nr:hypothetical protein [Entomospira entomophilus]NIZ40186.1 hypothetical protein [Entomospira entomophilus]WDI35745.1 hypothetical protein PVA45_01485 [Entomospira entomophilus]
MNNVALVVGRESFIGTKIVERLTLNGRDVVSLVADSAKSARVIPWNRSGFISTITALREMQRLYGFPTDVFIVFGRKREEVFPQESASLIDEVLDYDLKALVYLTQELYKRAGEQNKNTAIYFIADNVEDSKRPLSSTATSGFRTYAKTLMHGNPSIYLSGYELVGSDEEGFVDYVLKGVDERLEKRANSWMVYPKPSLFGLKR